MKRTIDLGIWRVDTDLFWSAVMELETEQIKENCGDPCQDGDECSCCQGYWDRMRHEGFWRDDTGWTNKAAAWW